MDQETSDRAQLSAVSLIAQKLNIELDGFQSPFTVPERKQEIMLQKAVKQTYTGFFTGALIGFGIGAFDGANAANWALREAKMTKTTASGIRFWHNTIILTALKKCLKTGFLLGGFVGTFSALQYFTSQYQRYDILNSMVSGAITATLFSARHGTLQTAWSAGLGLGLGAMVGFADIIRPITAKEEEHIEPAYQPSDEEIGDFLLGSMQNLFSDLQEGERLEQIAQFETSWKERTPLESQKEQQRSE